VATALRDAAAARRPGSEIVGAEEPLLLAHGRLDERTRRGATVDAWREIIAPTLSEILAA
jgi:hypothetical protein